MPYETTAFGTIEGLQNEIDLLNMKLFLPPEQQNDTIDLVRSTLHNLTATYMRPGRGELSLLACFLTARAVARLGKQRLILCGLG